MARFGLSPYANPVDAGIDAFAKITGTFQGMDKMQMEKEDHAQRRELMNVEMDEKEQDIEHKKGAQILQNLDIKHKMLHAPLVSAYTKSTLAVANGTQPEYTPEEVDAAFGLTKESPDLDNDPQKALPQVHAAHQLTQLIGQVQPALLQHAQSLPEGQRKVRLSSQQVPGLMEAFNQYAGPKLLEGKEAESLLIDFDRGVVIPVVRTGNADGSINPPEPHTKKDGDKEYIHEIPIDEFKNTLAHTASFGPMLLAAVAANEEGGEKFVEQVRKAGEQRKQTAAQYEALDELDKMKNKDDLSPGELRREFTKRMNKKGFNPTPAEVKEIIPDKDPVKLEQMKEEHQDEHQDKQIAAQSANTDKVIAGHMKVITAEINARSSLEDKKAAIKEKKDTREKEDEKLKKQISAELYKDPAWKERPSEEIDDEIDRRFDVKKSGKKLSENKPQGDVRIKPLKEFLADRQPDDISMESIGKQYTKDEAIKAAAGRPKMKKAIEDYYKEHPETKPQAKSASKTPPPKDKWLAAARAKNPGVADKDLEAFYNKKYGAR